MPYLPVPANCAAIQTFRLAPPERPPLALRHPELPTGTYEFYLGFDDRVDGSLNIVGGGVSGKFVQRTVQVQ